MLPHCTAGPYREQYVIEREMPALLYVPGNLLRASESLRTITAGEITRKAKDRCTKLSR